MRRALRDARARAIAFGYLFGAVAYIQPVAYLHTYPTLVARESFAHSFANNKAVVLFYGKAYNLLTVGGYTAWRVGGTLAIFAAVFGLLAAVRALRTEEDAGRTELVLAGILGRGATYRASMSAIAAGAVWLWLAALVGLLAGGLTFAGSAYLALAVASVVPVFAGIGALASQLAPSRRMALGIGGGMVALAFVLRVIADTSSSLGWLRWATPLGWAEELRPFTGAEPVVLLLPAGASVLMIAFAARISVRRDVGRGLLAQSDIAKPRMRLLTSPIAQALRGEWVSLMVWLAGTGAFAFIVGVISKSVSSAGISKPLSRELAKLGSGSVLSPKGYLGFSFIFFVLAVSLFACAQIAAARREEADERLETLLALPVDRRGWFGGRLVLAAAAAAVISANVSLLAWAGAASQGVAVSPAPMLEAGVNCLSVSFLFLGFASLAYAVVPRPSSAIAYGMVTVAFLWQLFAALLGAPRWLVDVTPFAHVGLVPAQPFQGEAVAIMAAIGLLAALAAIRRFKRRDLIGA